LPTSPDRVPAVAQAFLVGVAVLGDDRRDPVWVLHGEPESGRRAVIEDIDGIAIEADHLRETLDRLRDPVEGMAAAGHVGLAEARQVGSNNVKAVGQERDEVPEHMAGAREAMEQQQLRGAGRAGRAIEDVEAVHVGSSILDGSHGVFLCEEHDHLDRSHGKVSHGRLAPAWAAAFSPRRPRQSPRG